MDDIYITLEKVGNSWGRKLIVPEEFSIAGVEHDKNARCFRFRIPKLPEFSDMVDLSGLSCRVNYQHEYYDYAFQTDLMVEQGTLDDDYMVFRWVLGAECFPKAGTLSFILCCSLTGEDGIVKEWNSEIATVKVQKGLERDTQIIDQPDASTTGWATTARIADGAVTLEKLAEDVKDEFASLDEKITGAKEKAAQDDATLKKNIRDEYLNGIRYIGERFHGPCSRSGIEVMHIDGKTEQERTNGYQLLNAGALRQSGTGITATNNDGTITLSGTATTVNWVVIGFKANAGETVTISANNPVPADSFYMQLENKAGNLIPNAILYFNVANSSISVTLAEDCAQAAVRIPAGKTLNNFTFKPMINSGSTAKEWEPFTGGKPAPNTSYPMPLKSFEATEVVSMGRNVYKVTDESIRVRCTATQVEDGTIIIKPTDSSDLNVYVGDVAPAGHAYDVTRGELIQIPNGATHVYMKSFDGAFNYLLITFYNENKISLGFIRNYAGQIDTQIIEDAKYISVRAGKNTGSYGYTYRDRVMVSFDPIEEWVPPFYEEIELPEPIVLRSCATGEKDEYLGDGRILRRCREVSTMDISDLSFQVPDPTQVHSRIILNSSELKRYDRDVRRDVFCTVGRLKGAEDNGDGIAFIRYSAVYICCPDDITNEADAINWAKSNDIRVIYPLDIPYVEEYPMPILPSQAGDCRVCFESKIDTSIEWRPCPIGDRSRDVQELKAAIEALN